MSEKGARFARAWRDEMAAALDGSWSNHSGFLSEELSRRMPAEVHVEPQTTFYPFIGSTAGLSMLLEQRHPLPAETLSVHLWAHLWWSRSRTDMSTVHAGRYIPSFVRWAPTTLADLTRRWVPDPAVDSGAGRDEAHWSYLSLDESSGYGVAAERCIEALTESGVLLTWAPFVPGPGWGLGYEPVAVPDAGDADGIVVAHLVPEYLPLVRTRRPDALLVAHTAWDTTRIPDHWVGCLEAADLIVVPSRFSAEAIAASPVGTPVAIVPHVAPPPLSGRPTDWPRVAEDVVVFYTVAEWNERKAVFATIEAYLRAFTGRDRVLLLVKTSHRDRRVAAATPSAAGDGTTAWCLARLLASRADPPAVWLITRELGNAEIAALHGRGDCFVSLARGEGWGLGAFDAAAHGNPVVTTGFGGQLDFLGDSPYLVSFDLIPVDDPAGFPSYAPDQRWADANLDHAAALLREVAADPASARALAEPIGAEIRSRYSPAAVAAAFRDAVDRHAGAGSREGSVDGRA
jgi:glycosyltransferase involved in cell wall biosynthesis